MTWPLGDSAKGICRSMCNSIDILIECVVIGHIARIEDATRRQHEGARVWRMSGPHFASVTSAQRSLSGAQHPGRKQCVSCWCEVVRSGARTSIMMAFIETPCIPNGAACKRTGKCRSAKMTCYSTSRETRSRGSVDCSRCAAGALNQHVAIIRPDPDVLSPLFLRYVLVSPRDADAHVVPAGSGATVIALTKAMIESFEIKAPVDVRHEQRAIAHILGKLDDKIELNRRMNAILEAMARALFKSWFVDFDPVHAKAEGRDTGLPAEIADLFPDGFEESELGEVPEGWKVGNIRDCCTKIENGGTPQRSEPKYWQPATVPWLTSGEVRQSIVIGTDNMISEEGLAFSSAKVWPSGTTVVALYGATAGQVCLLAEKMCANQACCGLVPAESMRSYLYLGASSSVASLERQARGSAQQNLSQQIVADFGMLIAADSVMEAFEDLLNPMFERWILTFTNPAPSPLCATRCCRS